MKADLQYFRLARKLHDFSLQEIANQAPYLQYAARVIERSRAEAPVAYARGAARADVPRLGATPFANWPFIERKLETSRGRLY